VEVGKGHVVRQACWYNVYDVDHSEGRTFALPTPAGNYASDADFDEKRRR
jgi:hypothetical protein